MALFFRIEIGGNEKSFQPFQVCSNNAVMERLLTPNFGVCLTCLSHLFLHFRTFRDPKPLHRIFKNMHLLCLIDGREQRVSHDSTFIRHSTNSSLYSFRQLFFNLLLFCNIFGRISLVILLLLRGQGVGVQLMLILAFLGYLSLILFSHKSYIYNMNFVINFVGICEICLNSIPCY